MKYLEDGARIGLAALWVVKEGTRYEMLRYEASVCFGMPTGWRWDFVDGVSCSTVLMARRKLAYLLGDGTDVIDFALHEDDDWFTESSDPKPADVLYWHRHALSPDVIETIETLLLYKALGLLAEDRSL